MVDHETDVLIVGSGIAGCSAAIYLAKKNCNVTVITGTSSLAQSNSSLAQGGIVHLADDDSSELLASDIIAAGAGLCFPKAVEQLVSIGPSSVKETLIELLDVPFDRKENGDLDYTAEAAHSRSRVLHFRDQTGKAIMDTMIAYLERQPNVNMLTDHTAVDLITLAHHSESLTDIYKSPTCVGVYALDNITSNVKTFFAKETILATGGVGEVFLHTTNPSSARGDGLAMAYRAGARIMNMAYIQFHPTSLYIAHERRFLLTEALRGEGAEILSLNGSSFMHKYHEKGALAPRDIVARSIYQEMLRGNSEYLLLDISSKDPDWIKKRFPCIYEYALSKNLDMTKEPLPIVPAAHYSCGGVAVDGVGQTSIRRLRAIGEVSCTGVHGANRLASSSLLEGLVWGKTTADAISDEIGKYHYSFPEVRPWVMSNEVVDSSLIQQDWMSIKQTMWNYVGLVRDTRRLRRALSMLRELQWEISLFYEKAALTPELLGLRNGIDTALLIAKGAFRNRQSIGCHYREF